jgi:hypothetical protein
MIIVKSIGYLAEVRSVFNTLKHNSLKSLAKIIKVYIVPAFKFFTI